MKLVKRKGEEHLPKDRNGEKKKRQAAEKPE